MLVAATIAAVALLLAVTAAADAPAPATSPPAPAAGSMAVPGEIVLGFRSGVDAPERFAARSAARVRAKQGLLVPGAQLVKVEQGQTVAHAITALEKRSDVRYAEPNWIFRAASTTPNDPLFSTLWGLNNNGQAVNGHGAGTADADIDAPEAWDRSTGSSSVVAAVVDSGVAWDHPDLAPNIWSNPAEIPGNGIDDDGNGKVDDVRGWDFVDGDNNPWDYNDHGTHVAGTLAARGNDGSGISGVAWQASIMPVRVLDASRSGTTANIADGLAYAADNGAKVVNASIVSRNASMAVRDAITNHPNTLFVVAAGNDGTDSDATPTFPCSYTAVNLICVAATDNTDTLARFSNYGATSVDLAAPGVDIDSAKPHYTNAFTDDFKTDFATKWTVESGPWGTLWGDTSNWLTESPAGNYADNADWAVRTSSAIDLGARSDCVLKFSYETFLQQGFDWLYVQSSTDGTTWTDLGKIGDTNGLVRLGFFPVDGGRRYVRFRFTSDASVNKDGVFISKVRIACPGGTYDNSDYQFMSGTSMASPQVAGAAAVLYAAKPSATVAAVKAALLDGGDSVAGLSGKTVSGRRLNLNGALASLGKTDTTTTVTSGDPDPSSPGQPVTVQYTVTADAPGPGPPTGTVTVSDGTDSCTGTVAEGRCTITFATAGSKSLTATYAGDPNYNTSPPSASLSHQVNRLDTAITITSDDPDPSVLSEVVRVNFVVAPVAPVASGNGTASGNVTVSDGVDSCTATVAAGYCAITMTTVGGRMLVAHYEGDSNFKASSSPGMAHTVTPAPGAAIELQVVNPLAPRLTRVFGASQTHATFRVSPNRQLAQASRRRPIGTVLKYHLDSAAAVRFDFGQALGGRTVNGRCLRPSKRNKSNAKCTLQRGTLAFAGHVGLNTVRFNGWLSRTKKLTPGNYTLVISAITPGVGATSQTLRFTIVR